MAEKGNPLSRGMDLLATEELLRVLHASGDSVRIAVGEALSDIERLVEEGVAAIRSNGYIYYAGAGTSGRLGVLDAAEIWPTFGNDRFRAFIAGGERAVTKSAEGAEDDEAMAVKDASVVSDRDLVLGISASGSTPYVMSFLRAASEKGARCWILKCSEAEVPSFVNGTIAVLTGPEIIGGSTRLNAGTATKLVLNMFSSAVMVRLGGVYDGLMVDVVPSNMKLRSRAEDIVRRISGCSTEAAAEALRQSAMRPKVAAVMAAKRVTRERAEALLAEAGGFLRKALEG